jgi:hypothetical protein
MKKKFETVIKCLISKGEKEPLTGIDISEQFRPDENTPDAILRNLNAAFLIALCGRSHPLYSRADHFIREIEKDPAWKNAADFYQMGLTLVHTEIAKRSAEDKKFRENLDGLYAWISGPLSNQDPVETADRFWNVFFPEGVSLFENRSNNIDSLRRKREVRIVRLNPEPIQDPAREILFTSNILLTINAPSKSIEDLSLSRALKEKMRQTRGERQVYWYDHPIQMGVEIDRNEAVYGIRELDQAIEFEKDHGPAEKKEKTTCVLSVSVTHPGLKDMARDYIEEVFREAGGVRHLSIYVFSESDVLRLVSEIISPAAMKYSCGQESDLFGEIIGVDGEYGRHYSFLKAISAFWQVFMDPGIKATFKIDLDQVFPQNELVNASNNSAFEHFKTPLWGAEGEDERGKRVELGMIAGALVNQEDIGQSLFTPDVKFPGRDIEGDEWVFYSPLPQALSTEAEMMTRYTKDSIDGQTRCIQRVHVTGGTCGILVSSLRRHRPFTPCFIGRAEDQAYLLSVLFREREGNLRYVHKDGLIMRHDKEAFADEAIKAAFTGKLIGDYVRILLFSYYAKGLPWSVESTKQSIDPFTGCFVSYIPLTVVYLRLALKGASLFRSGKNKEGFALLEMGTERLRGIIKKLTDRPDSLGEMYLKEKAVWDSFYDVLDKVEEGVKQNDPFALDLVEKAKNLIRDCKIDV